MNAAYDGLYTKLCTNLSSSGPTPNPSALHPLPTGRLLTLADWRAAWLEGADVRSTLHTHLQLGAAQPAAPAWILRRDAAALAPQIDALAAAAEATPDRSHLLQRLPLFGVPFAVKDNIDVAGWPTTAGCPAFAYQATRDAAVVQRLREAGALLIGKTNLDQFATGLVGTRSPYGAPASTLAPAHVSGGSSSGSAVVVSRGEVAFALGTDTAGSGRVPAAFNNIVGLKPTPGRVSTRGVVPACRSLDCVSVFALTVDDAALVLAVLEGADAQDDHSRFEPGPAILPTPLRLGVPRALLLDAAQGHAPAWAAALDRARALGAHIVEIDFAPLHAVAQQLYDGPWLAERQITVQPLLQAQPDALDATVAAVIAAAAGFSAADAFRGQYRLLAQRRETAVLWQQVDALMVPTAPRHPSFAEVAADPIGANAVLGTYTNFVNLLGWCALALPAGFGAAGLPFGITLIAPANADAALLPLARRWQAASALPLGATDARSSASPLPGPTAPQPATRRTLSLAVVGAHLSGLPLNAQLTERGATLRAATHTAPLYRLYALPGSVPPKPGLLRVAEGGQAIAVEIWDLPIDQVGAFLALIPQPLGLGTLTLGDSSAVHGFLCEAVAMTGAHDITGFGGWRAYLADRPASVDRADPSPFRAAQSDPPHRS